MIKFIINLLNKIDKYFTKAERIYAIAEHTIGEFKYYLATYSDDAGKTYQYIHSQLMKSENEAINIINEFKKDPLNWLKVEFKKI